MNQKEIIKSISEIITFSNFSHTLRTTQLNTFIMGYKYSNGPIKLLPIEIFQLISTYVKRNSWKDTKKILQKIKNK